MANKKISYTTRDFQSIRTELINFTRTYYPDVVDNFNDASVFSVLMDLNAAVTDNLHYNIDRSIQETVLQYAQQRSSVYNIARTYGLKIPGQRPSVALTDFSITVPAFGDKEDERYLGVLRKGSQVFGAGQVFENVTDIDFANNIITHNTCAGVAIAEKFKPLVQKYNTKIMILVPGALLKENWKQHIIKCTGETYMKKIDKSQYIDHQELDR